VAELEADRQQNHPVSTRISNLHKAQRQRPRLLPHPLRLLQNRRRLHSMTFPWLDRDPRLPRCCGPVVLSRASQILCRWNQPMSPRQLDPSYALFVASWLSRHPRCLHHCRLVKQRHVCKHIMIVPTRQQHAIQISDLLLKRHQ
jgi:hypothetical protein